MIVMALGDCHGDRAFTKQAITWASENGVDRIVQVGDFGYWPRTNNGQRFTHDVGKHAQTLGVSFYWIDGNHEDHDLIDSVIRIRGGGMLSHGKYPITYIDRGHSWEWGGVKFGAFGGAFSIDRAQRIKCSGVYGWFPQELPDPSKIELLGKVDVLFTHDSPIVPPSVYANRNFKADDTSRQSQRDVYDALLSSGASLLIHGHWHLNERYKVAGAVIQALDMNYSNLYRAGILFDTDSRRLFTLQEWEYRNADQ